MKKEIETTGYSPGVWAQACLEAADKQGVKAQRWSSGIGIIQARKDDAGVWHFYTEEEA